MSSVCRSLLICALFATAFAPVRAQTLIGEFALQGNLNNNVSGGAALVPVAFNSVTGQITSSGYVFSANQGLSFTSTAFTPANFSIELSFNFSSISGWTKIADFSNLTSDIGFYQLNGDLNFFNVIDSGVQDFSPGTRVDVVLTRDGATGNLVGYVNGVQRITFNDSSAFAVTSAPGNSLIFFVDDVATGQREASGGTLNYLRIYDGALTPSQVAALYAAGAPSAIPEPGATAAMLGVGALGLLVLRRSARR